MGCIMGGRPLGRPHAAHAALCHLHLYILNLFYVFAPYMLPIVRFLMIYERFGLIGGVGLFILSVFSAIYLVLSNMLIIHKFILIFASVMWRGKYLICVIISVTGKCISEVCRPIQYNVNYLPLEKEMAVEIKNQARICLLNIRHELDVNLGVNFETIIKAMKENHRNEAEPPRVAGIFPRQNFPARRPAGLLGTTLLLVSKW